MNTETELDQLDNPTEWGSIVATAIIDPARTPEMARRADIKLAVQTRCFCDCGSILDQQTAVGLVDAKGNVRNVSCPKCMRNALRDSLKKMTERYGVEHTRETITHDFSLIAWTSTTTGAEIWSTYSTPAPRQPRQPKADRWLTPAQVQDDCQGWTPGAVLVVAPRYCIRPDAAGRQKLSKRAPDGLQNHERFPRIIATAERWLSMIPGHGLTEGETAIDDSKFASTSMIDACGRKHCDIATQILRTAEHYCGPGHWCAGPPKELFVCYRNAEGQTLAIVAQLTDND